MKYFVVISTRSMSKDDIQVISQLPCFEGPLVYKTHNLALCRECEAEYEKWIVKQYL